MENEGGIIGWKSPDPVYATVLHDAKGLSEFKVVECCG